MVLGAPDYYYRFGFRTAELFGLENEYGASEEFMALELKIGSITPGLVRYAPEFSGLTSAISDCSTGKAPRRCKLYNLACAHGKSAARE